MIDNIEFREGYLDSLRQKCVGDILGLIRSGYKGYLPIGRVGDSEVTRDLHVEVGDGDVYVIDSISLFFDHSTPSPVDLLKKRGRQVIPEKNNEAVTRAVTNLDPTKLYTLADRIEAAEKSLQQPSTDN